MKKIQVLIVDDSALVRQILSAIVNSADDMNVVACASDPFSARELIKQHNPDVLTLDIEMPKMDGLDFLERLMRLHPMPVVMVSTMTEKGADATMRALELGAVDFVAKPRVNIAAGLEVYAQEILDKIRIASRSRLGLRHSSQAETMNASRHVATISGASEKLILVGASTGGTEAIKDFLIDLPANSPPILIVQHMPPGFTTSFSKRLNGICKINVSEARHNERALPGHAYIAPGGHHLKLRRSGAYYHTELSDENPYNLHRPSVDVLFLSAAPLVGKNACAALLTGMGKDGAQGLLSLRKAGVYTMAQSEASCVVFGMPREAIQIGAADAVMDVNEMGLHLIRRFNGGS